MGEVVEFIDRFAAFSRAPVRTRTAVTAVARDGDGYHVTTTNGEFRCRTLVIASGACNRPHVPAVHDAIPPFIRHVTPFDYRNPSQLPEGRVLVVGPSATGVQLAAEIHRSGRPVTLSVGEHVRLPRTYRGRDVLWWMDAVWRVGSASRRSGRPHARAAAALAAAGRDAGARDARPQRPLRLGRRAGRTPVGRARRTRALLGRAAEHVLARRSEDGAPARHVRRMGEHLRTRARRRARPSASPPRACRRPLACRSISHAATTAPSSGRRAIGRITAGCRCPWSTRRATSATSAAWSKVPGMYALGLPVLRRRKSTFIHGIEDDAREVIANLAGFLDADTVREV